MSNMLHQCEAFFIKNLGIYQKFRLGPILLETWKFLISGIQITARF